MGSTSCIDEFVDIESTSHRRIIFGWVGSNLRAVSSYCFEKGIKDLKGVIHAQRGVGYQVHRV